MKRIWSTLAAAPAVCAIFSQPTWATEAISDAAQGQPWFDMQRVHIFAVAVLLSAAFLYYTRAAAKGSRLFIRKIAGLDAVEEAIGRATEMGRPILFVPGIQDLDNVQTIAGLIILGRISKTIAEYDTPLDVPVAKSLVLTTGREMVREGYIAAGRPDSFRENIVHYLTDEQFAYVAGVNGIIMRDKPATCFYLGAFFAESLLLAETGNAIGSIQIAGTAMPSQIPFFIAACDYTLIGEELFAASAYLSQDPQLLGSLRGQDVGKFFAMVAIALGTVLATLASLSSSPALQLLTSGFTALFGDKLPPSFFP